MAASPGVSDQPQDPVQLKGSPIPKGQEHGRCRAAGRFPSALVLYRRDLRVADNGALRAAMESGPTIAAYILDDAADGRPMGSAARWWLHHALRRLQRQLAALNVPLVLRQGDQNAVVEDLVAAQRVDSVFWNRRYTPWGYAQDHALERRLRGIGIQFASYPGAYIREPWQVRTRAGGCFKVFGPFFRAFQATGEPEAPLGVPHPQSPLSVSPERDESSDGALLPLACDCARGLQEAWAPGASTADRALARFIEAGVPGYGRNRDRTDLESTSVLSPYLAFGELSPRQVWQAVRNLQLLDPDAEEGVSSLLRQLAWREFSAALLHGFPNLGHRPFRARFERFPWTDDPASLSAWQHGRTGYPWIDAGMRQLRTTGWIHNRLRMGVASFLTKHLLVHWRLGEAWFWDRLVDADPAQNITNWQWVAGCGPDAAPFFRIFNPVTQGKRSDPTRSYLRRWQPEASGYEPGSAGIPPLVSHLRARDRALAAFRSLPRIQEAE